MSSLFKKWLKSVDKTFERTATDCSMHGVNWYLRIKSPWLKSLFAIASTIALVAMSILMLERSIYLYGELSNESASQKHKTFTQRHYPNLTICHPKFFNQKMINSLNMSIELAWYVLAIFDPTMVVKLQQANKADRIQTDHLNQELDRILHEVNSTLPVVLKKISITCPQIVAFCSVSGTIFNSEECCENSFNVTPIFTSRGVCYTSQVQELAYSASEFYGVEIWMTANIAGFEYLNLSSEFINMKLLFNGIYYVLTDKTELPVVALIQDSKIVQPTEHHWLKLETNVIQRPLPCVSQSQIVNQHACESIIQYQSQMNCSCAQYYGIESYAPENLPDCTPALALKVDFFATTDSKNEEKPRKCLPLCNEEFSKFTSTVAKIAGSELNQHLPSNLNENIQRDDLSSIRMYYGTFKYTETVLALGSPMTIVADIGGNFGLFMGASLISLMEWLILCLWSFWDSLVFLANICKT